MLPITLYSLWDIFILTKIDSKTCGINMEWFPVLYSISSSISIKNATPRPLPSHFIFFLVPNFEFNFAIARKRKNNIIVKRQHFRKQKIFNGLAFKFPFNCNIEKKYIAHFEIYSKRYHFASFFYNFPLNIFFDEIIV